MLSTNRLGQQQCDPCVEKCIQNAILSQENQPHHPRASPCAYLIRNPILLSPPSSSLPPSPLNFERVLVRFNLIVVLRLQFLSPLAPKDLALPRGHRHQVMEKSAHLGRSVRHPLVEMFTSPPTPSPLEGLIWQVATFMSRLTWQVECRVLFKTKRVSLKAPRCLPFSCKTCDAADNALNM